MEAPKWEHVPEPKILKEHLDETEVKLTKLADRIRHFRTQIFLHYRLTWRVGFITLGALMVISSIFGIEGLGMAKWAVWCIFLGPLVIALGVLGPASSEGLIIKPCHCEHCDLRKDLR